MHLICICFLEALGIYVSPLNAPLIPLFLLTSKSGHNNNHTQTILTNAAHDEYQDSQKS